MTLKKCDGCGKIFSPDDHAVGTIKESIYDSNHTSWQCDDVFDYCTECTEKVDKFLREKSWHNKK